MIRPVVPTAAVAARPGFCTIHDAACVAVVRLSDLHIEEGTSSAAMADFQRSRPDEFEFSVGWRLNEMKTR
jgi:hypothetical protein